MQRSEHVSRLSDDASAQEILAATPEQRLDWQDRWWARHAAKDLRRAQNDELADNAIHAENQEWCD